MEAKALLTAFKYGLSPELSRSHYGYTVPFANQYSVLNFVQAGIGGLVWVQDIYLFNQYQHIKQYQKLLKYVKQILIQIFKSIPAKSNRTKRIWQFKISIQYIVQLIITCILFQMASKTQKPKMRVQNISCVIPETDVLGGLYVGNTYGAQNSDILKQYGIRAVLTTSIQTPVNYDPIAIPFHLKIQAHDKENYSIVDHLQQCLNFIHRCRQLTNVYVHCYAGVSRSVTIVIAYIMKYWKWNLKNTLQFVQLKRVVAKPNQGFMEQLKKYQQTLFPTQRLSQPQTQVPKPISNQGYAKLNTPSITRHQSAFQNSNLNLTKSKINNQMIPPNYLTNTRHPNHLETSVYKKHSQIPIPKILTNKGPDRNSLIGSPSLSPALHHKYSSQSSSQVKYGTEHVNNFNNTTSSNSIFNGKNNRPLIRPKDLPGYKQ